MENSLDPRGDSVNKTQQTKVLVIGGGYSGIGAAIRLKSAGIDDFIMIEKAAKLGGTWRENTYPMAGADTPSIIYSFSYARNPDWDYTFALQPQIERYLDELAAARGIDLKAQFNTAATASRWDEDEQRWVVETNQGTIHAKYLISCAGPMHEAAMPDIPGVDEFAGDSFHTANWNHEVDLKGKRVAVIGTGASAIQYVPVIQKQVKELILFQRTAPWVMPRMNRRASSWKKALYRRFPAINQAVADVVYLGSEGLQLLQRSPRTMRPLERFALMHLRRQVKDQSMQRQLTPSFAMGCKRILFSNSWYPAITATNATVVSSGVSEITPTGLIDSEGVHHDADVIIYSTGFRVTDPDIAKHVRGRDGRLLCDHWQGSPQAYQSTTVHGFPNLFVMLGPNVGNGHGSVTTLVEMLANYAADGIQTTDTAGATSFDVKRRVQELWNDEVQDALRGTVWNAGGCGSYYLDANGRNSSIYPWTTLRFRRDTRQFDLNDYDLTLPTPEAPRAPEKATIAA